MERKTTASQRPNWRGEKTPGGLYRIAYEPPMTVMEILGYGPSSLISRLLLFAFVFGTLGVLFCYKPATAAKVFEWIKGPDIILTIVGAVILALSFLLGKKFGRLFGLTLKWLGMPMLFLGIFGLVFARMGFAAFWVGPVDLYLGKTTQNLIADGVGNGAFHSLLGMLTNLKMLLLKQGPDGSILTVLVHLYRNLGATMNNYAVIPVLILISLGIFLGTVVLLWLGGWLTLLIPAFVCNCISRVFYRLDEKY